MPPAKNPFFPTYKSAADAPFQLICFSYAGGSALAYRTWPAKLAPHFEVSMVELPGRGRRFGEAPYRTLDAVLPPLTAAVEDVLDGRPFAFFGYSMGALLSFELAHRLHQKGSKLPAVLFVAARGPREHEAPIHHLPHDQFLEKLRRYDGTPSEVLNDAEMMELFLPTIRADFAIAYSDTVTAPLPVPIEAIGATEDSHVPVANLSEWGTRTTARFRTTIFPGGHFFVREHEDAILTLLKDRLIPPA